MRAWSSNACWRAASCGLTNWTGITRRGARWSTATAYRSPRRSMSRASSAGTDAFQKARCGVVSLLPTFVGTAAARGRQRLPMTALIFAAGVAAVLLPVVLGIGALGQVFGAQRRIIFFIVGI